jgi:hypothetical protein
MDGVSLATAFVAARQGEVQMAVAAKMMRMNADSAQAVVALLDAAQKNFEQLANVAAGVGGNLDITA